MYFKRIELNGFKSFADPVTIEFTDGITCIVGPNGSGKSNISDAIRWVLGEQSPKMLRGGKMEEVIFAGTQNRKPKGMAEVTLVIDNSDHSLPIEYEEVGITRRMYRSGESEYLINKVPCRLKDIRELIMDTGIGVEGYSIIGQGKIADIIDNKMDSRREIFEEAAGIVKYRTKKTEAERKLDSASSNMDRVNDIIAEIESRIGGLKEDSEKASEYLDLKEKYRKLEINIILKNVEQAQEKSSAVTEELAELEQGIEDSRFQKEELETKLKDTRDKAEALEEKLEGYRADLLKKVEEINFITSREALNDERLNTLERDKTKLAEDIKSIEEKISRETENALQTRKAGEAVKKEMEDASALLAEKQKLTAEAEKALADAEARKIQAGKDAALSRVKIENLKVNRGKLSARLHLLDELEKSYEGYSGSVRFVMNQKLSGIIGVLGDLLQVPSGWEIAVETILAAKMQNIVCRDDAVAKKAIEILKKNQAGRVTFLPVDNLRVNSAPDTSDLQNYPGYLGLASDRVSCKGGYTNVVEYTLNRVVVCDKLDNALRMSNEVGGPFKFVTLEGEIINAAGAITGGSFKNNTGNILSRKAEKDKLAKSIADSDKQIASEEQSIADAEKNAGSMEGELAEIRAKLDSARNAEAEAKMAESNAAVRAQGSRELESRVADALRELESEKNSKLKGLDSLDFEKNEIASFKEVAAAAMKDKEAEKAGIEEQINSAAEERRQCIADADALETQRTQADSALYDIQVKHHDADVRKARCEAQIENFKEKLWEEFEITFAEAADKEDPDFVMSRAVRDAKEYRDRIRELGDVNVGAIEEYKQVSERYEFLTAQREDLNQAIAELKDVISDMDQTIKKKFKESFDAVVDNFESTFQELFKGGHARLTMEDPENPLETTIEIEAQPPGKKLQNMNLLSGGEKTMTAIALMFAVLKSKPTPFCILDEVEAALDETNIDCFAKYLSNFGRTQFALVTHQKATMEYADALYGVTMPEHGITQILSLRLGEDFDM